MSKTRRALGWGFVAGSLLMYFLTVGSYAFQPDFLAAFTVFPIWVWGGIGLSLSFFALCSLRAPRSLIITGLWVITLILMMDEAKALLNFNHPEIAAERSVNHGGGRIIRVATVNCAEFAYGDPMDDLKKWDPDIVLLQQVYPQLVKRISESLYGGKGNYRAFMSNGIVTRYEIRRHVTNPMLRNQQITARLPGGDEIEVVNVHLATAATDMRLWSRESRALHIKNRNTRREELSDVLKVMQKTTNFPTDPIILGGDFNSGATDVAHRQLTRDFDDAFLKVGRGWGDTFHRRFPIHRIDHIYSAGELKPVACGVIVSKKTDHRIVIADLLLRN